MFNKLSLVALVSMGVASISCNSQQTTASEEVSDVASLLSPSQIYSVRTWKITADPALNCREDAGTENQVIFALNKGIIADSVLDQYGRAEVKADSKGRNWVRINPRGDTDHNDCYVLAESRYIEPIVTTRLQKSFVNSVSSWEVTADPALNCREGAGTQNQVIFELRKGIILDSVKDVDGSTITDKDRNGNLWIKVNPRGDTDHNDCYIFADSRYVKPMTRLQSSAEIEGDVTCPITVRTSELLASLQTKSRRIYVCQTFSPDGSHLHYLAYDKNSTDTQSPSLYLFSPIQEAFTAEGFVFKNEGYSYVIPFPEENTLSKLKVLRDVDGTTESVANLAIFNYYISEGIIVN